MKVPKVSVWKHPTTGIYHLNWREPLGGCRYRRHRPSTGLRDRRGAEAAARAKARELAAAPTSATRQEPESRPAPDLTLDDFLTRYLRVIATDKAKNTHIDYRFTLRAWARWVQQERPLTLRELTADHLQDYKTARLEQGRAVATINGYIRVIKRAFAWAEEMGYLEASPMRHVHLLQEALDSRPKILTAEEETRVMEQLVGHTTLLRIYLVLRGCGLRRNELVYLEKEQIHLELPAIWLTNKPEFHLKRYRPHWVPIAKNLIPILEDQLTTPGCYLFDKGNDTPYLSPDRLTKRLGAHFAAAGIERKRRLHALRHTFGTRAIQAGVDPGTLQAAMGHSRLETTARYIRVPREEVISAGDLVTLPPFTEVVAKSVAKSVATIGHNKSVTI